MQEKYIKRRGNVAMEETYERDFNKNGPRILKKKVIAPENSKTKQKLFSRPSHSSFRKHEIEKYNRKF